MSWIYLLDYYLSVNRVAIFKYLDHFLTDGLEDDGAIERERRSLAVRGNMLARIFYRCSKEVKLTLFKADNIHWDSVESKDSTKDIWITCEFSITIFSG